MTSDMSSAVDMSKLGAMPMPPSDANVTTKMFSVKGSSPSGLIILFMDETGPPQTFNFTLHCSDKESRYFLKTFSDDPSLVMVTADDTVIDCANSTPEIVPLVPETPPGNPSYTSVENERHLLQGSKTVHFKADMIGRTFISFVLFNDSGAYFYKEVKLPVTIFRNLRIVDYAFQILVYVFLIFVTLAFGCKLDLTIVKENLKRPIAPCIGLGCQFVIMPMVSVLNASYTRRVL